MGTLFGISVVNRDEKLLEKYVSIDSLWCRCPKEVSGPITGTDGLGLGSFVVRKYARPHPNVMSTLPGSNIVKRGENHPESQLAIIPYGTGDQTSFSDQLQSTDGLGLCLPLHETRPEPKHKIFLSHNGAQKSCVKQLCEDIERYDRYPSF